jgi:hypothetical protein
MKELNDEKSLLVKALRALLLEYFSLSPMNLVLLHLSHVYLQSERDVRRAAGGAEEEEADNVRE